MDLDYKHCKYFKEAEEKEHCPFSTVCKDNCIFSLMNLQEDYEQLERDYNKQDERISHMDDYEEDYKSLQEEFGRFESSVEEYKIQMNEYLYSVLVKLSKYEEVPLTESCMDELTNVDIMVNKINKERKNVE